MHALPGKIGQRSKLRIDRLRVRLRLKLIDEVRNVLRICRAVGVDERTAAFDAGKSAGKNGDTYNLVTVLLAASLFVLGIAGLFRATLTRIAAIAIGAALFISASVWMLTLPVAS